MDKIQIWQIQCKLTDDGAWNDKITVEFDRDDLSILITALQSGEYEGNIGTSEMEYMFDKLNIDKGW